MTKKGKDDVTRLTLLFSVARSEAATATTIDRRSYE